MTGSTRHTGASRRRPALRALAIAVVTAAVAALAPAIATATSYQWKGEAYMPVLTATGASWEGKLVVTDTEGWEKGQKISEECIDKFEGSVSTGGSGEITKLVSSECKGINGGSNEECSTSKIGTTIVGSDLPWKTEVVKSELGSPIIRVLEDGKGAPALKIECLTLGFELEDTCTGNLALNVTKMVPTTATFNNKEILDCSFHNGSPTGHAEGTQTLTGVFGLEEGTPVWNVAGAINWSKGSLTVIDEPIGPNGKPWGVTCEDAGEGTTSTVGAGTITKETLSKCAQSIDSECNGTDSIEALHLPWKTQLYAGSAEAISDAFAEDGAGTVAFKIRCEAAGVRSEDTCEAPTDTGGRLGSFMTNVTGGVLSKFYEPSAGLHLTCHRGLGPSEFSESSRTLKLSAGGTLTVSG